MTGFARAAGAHGGQGWTWEARSVNAKALDVRCRLAPGFEHLEVAVRAAAAQRLRRGNLSVSLNLAAGGSGTRLKVNRALLDEVMAIAREVEAAGAAPPQLDALLAVRGVIEPADAEDDAARAGREEAMGASLARCLDLLARAREEEGQRLLPALAAHLDRCQALAGEAARSAAVQPAALRERLKAQVALLMEASPALPEERLAQEAALLATRADIREEIDRLTAHIAQARALLAEGGAVGRRLDFLCQELNREANTICSKSFDLELTRRGLELKSTIEQLREQVQNIE
jgi:uncharacterized protein (TIGR00255 family)